MLPQKPFLQSETNFEDCYSTNTHMCTVNREKFAPVLFSTLSPSLSSANLGLGEFQCPKYPYSNTTLSLRIHDGTKPCGKKEGRKLNRAKKTV